MRSKIVPLIASLVAVVLQIVVAPVISFSDVVPNFLVALVIVLSIVRNPDTTYLYAFVLGLLSDLFSQTPLGLTPLLLLVASFVLSRAFEALDRDSITMACIAAAITSFVFEIIFAIVLLIVGYSTSFFDLLLYRALPIGLYNTLLCIALYLLSRKFSFGQPSSDAWTVSSSHRYR